MPASLETAIQAHRAGRLTEAEVMYRDVLEREPRKAEAMHLLGVVAHQSTRHAEAIDLITRAIALDGTVAPYHHTLGEAHRAAGDPAAALSHYARAIELRPAYADAHNNLGRALEMLGRPSDALAMYRRAVAIEPDHAKAQFNLGLTSLLLGDYATGWREYEWRLRIPEIAGTPANAAIANLPRWDGSDPAGRTILVHGEQGFGDCIQFARYLPLLIGRGADVIVVCPRPLVRLFGSLPGVCVVADGDPPPRADLHVPIASLPLAFATTPATIPTFAAYLRADVRLAAAWRDRLRPHRAGGRRLVGVAWAGNPAQAEDRWRSLHLNDLAPLAAATGVRFVSLQKGPAAAQAAMPPPGLDLLDVSGSLHDFADTAALVSQLDLVIATDTSVAHLAGALGKPAWTLIRYAADWRWSLTGDDSAWYPSMRLFRQAARGDWSLVVTDLLNRLKATAPAPTVSPLAA